MKTVRWYLRLSGIILLLTAGAKVASSFGHAKILMEHEPVAGLTFRTLFLTAAFVEMVIGLICLHQKRIELAASLLAWLASGILAYRWSLWELGWQQPCHCLGTFTDSLHIPPDRADFAMKVVLVYLLLGSYLILLWLWRRNRQCARPKVV